MNTDTPNPADVAPPEVLCENASSLVIETHLKGYPIFRMPVTSTSKRNGRQSRFPLDDLEVGQCFFLATEKEACAARSAAYVMRRKGSEKRFAVTGQRDHETGQLQWVAQRIA